jgi:diguanylate cyclase (GGDEF)-like protein/PAS domain S-box-containing protein
VIVPAKADARILNTMLDNIDVYRTVLESVPVPVFIKDANHRFVFINRLACSYFGKPAEEIIGKSDYDFFPPEQVDIFRAKDQLVLSTGQDNENEEVVTDQEGTVHTVVTRKSLLTVNQDKYLLVSMNDITALRESETRARYLAHHDNLTGLPNRITLYERLNHLLARASSAESAVALLLVDLDGFKSVNDTYGHQAGDELLREYGRRLNAIVHEPDLVVRMGGDEFAVLVCAPAWNDRLELLCMRIVEAASAPFQVAGVHSYVRASLGAFRIGAADISAGEVIRRADTALYEAKHQGKGRYCVYSQALDAGLIHRRTIENELTQALVNGTGLGCAYQPLIRGEDGCIVGVEALARWEHPSLGNVPPSQFIPVAEESGLISRLGEWVLRRACREAKQWTNIFLAVNVSAIQLRSGNFTASVLRILREEAFPPISSGT